MEMQYGSKKLWYGWRLQIKRNGFSDMEWQIKKPIDKRLKTIMNVWKRMYKATRLMWGEVGEMNILKPNNAPPVIASAESIPVLMNRKSRFRTRMDCSTE